MKSTLYKRLRLQLTLNYQYRWNTSEWLLSAKMKIFITSECCENTHQFWQLEVKTFIHLPGTLARSWCLSWFAPSGSPLLSSPWPAASRPQTGLRSGRGSPWLPETSIFVTQFTKQRTTDSIALKLQMQNALILLIKLPCKRLCHPESQRRDIPSWRSWTFWFCVFLVL